MSRGLAAFDRLIVLLVALVIAFFGVWAILFHFNNYYAQRLTQYVDQEMWQQAPDQQWFTWVLVAIIAGCTVLGLWFILANIRRKRINQVHSEDASSREGEIRFNVSDIGSAVAGQLERAPKVSSVKSLVAFDRGRPTMEFTVNANADADVPSIRSQIEQAERDIRDAIGNADVDTVYRIHLDTVDHA